MKGSDASVSPFVLTPVDDLVISSPETVLYAQWLDDETPISISTPFGENSTIYEPNYGVGLLFDRVTSEGNCDFYTTITRFSEPPVGTYFNLTNSYGYYDISPEATFEGSVQVSFAYDPLLTEPEEDNLKIFQFKDGEPIDITSNIDKEKNVIYGTVTDHFCAFAIGTSQVAKVETSTSYTGQTLVQSPSTANLACQIKPLGGSSCIDYSMIQARFVVSSISADGIETEYARFTEPCDMTGVASADFELPVGIYHVTVEVVESNYVYPSSDTTLLAVFDPSGGFATGAGWFNNIDSETGNIGKAHFAFETKYNKSIASGSMEFKYQNAEIALTSKQIDWLVISSVSVQFSGAGTIKGREGLFSFRVSCLDNQYKDAPDAITIQIWEGSDTEQDPVYKAINQILVSGNIIVKKR